MKYSTAIITVFSVLLASTKAMYAIGQCPTTYPKVNNPFGATGDVANGQYYSHMMDDQYFTMVKSLMLSSMTPAANRIYGDCNRKTFTKRNGGVYVLQRQYYNGTSGLTVPFNFTCNGFQCYDPNFDNSDFEVAYYDATSNILILYNCIEMSSMIEAIVQQYTPLISQLV